MMNIFETLSANPSFEGAIKAASVIEPGTPEIFRKSFDAVCESLAEDYQEGTRDYFRELHPSLLVELRETDDQMVQAWRNGDLPIFEANLTRWADTHREMIREFKES